VVNVNYFSSIPYKTMHPLLQLIVIVKVTVAMMRVRKRRIKRIVKLKKVLAE
jgi:hypothetical protein